MSIKQNIQTWTEMKTAGKNTKKCRNPNWKHRGCTEKKATVHRSPSQITERVGERRQTQEENKTEAVESTCQICLNLQLFYVGTNTS